ncbi:MAG: NAD(+)/NADH kinase [Acidimicrobiales bacterium]
MITIGFVLHPGHDQASELYAVAVEVLRAHGAEAIRLFDRVQADESIAAVVSLGGDGTMLRAVAAALLKNIPVLGVNLGHLGYLAEVEPSEMPSALEWILSGNYETDDRMLIEAIITRASVTESSGPVYYGLNEVVIERQGSGHVIRGDVSIDLDFFLHYEADGLIISTATGSTAYNLSSRGPIVAPDLRALVITPISPHMLFDRSLVLGGNQTVEFVLAPGPSAALMVDGEVRDAILPGDRVQVRASLRTARLVRFRHRPFQQIMKQKFRLPDAFLNEHA